MRDIATIRAEIERLKQEIALNTRVCADEEIPDFARMYHGCKRTENTEKLFQVITEGIPLDELETLCNAHRAGLAAILPCEVGDTVYWCSRFGNTVHQGKVFEIKISSFGFDLELRTAENQRFLRESEKCYPTREAAEAALKEREKSARI